MQIKFNKYINRIGIEFEGMYKIRYLEESKDKFKSQRLQTKGDGSLSNTVGYDYCCREIITPPCKDKKITRILEMWDEAYKNNDYKLNETVGLHFHVSLQKNYYAYIVNQEFFDKFVELLKTFSPKVYNEREKRSYCKMYPSERHFKLCSSDRYRAVNYCYTKHKTVEFRAYGGTHATIEEFAGFIQATLDLIKQTIDEKTTYDSVKDKIKVFEGDSMTKAINYVAPKIEPTSLVIQEDARRRPVAPIEILLKSHNFIRDMDIDITYN